MGAVVLAGCVMAHHPRRVSKRRYGRNERAHTA